MIDTHEAIIIAGCDETNLNAAKSALVENHNVLIAPSKEKLFNILEEVTPELILLDVDTPDIDGYDVLKTLKSDEKTAEIPILLLSATNDSESHAKGLSLGAADYVSKPISKPLLTKRVGTYILLDQQAKLETIVKTVTSVIDVSDKRFDTDSTDKMMQYLQNFISIMSKTDDYAEEIANWDIDMLLISAQIHDIGKSAISGEILNKAESLTDAEFENVKSHVGVGVDMIRKISKNIGDKDVLRYAEAIAATHHEKWDGTGYPFGLKGEEIPLQGRVMSLVDTYDALTSNRPHREKIAHDKAIKTIQKLGGTHFDPHLVSLFVANEHVFGSLNT